MPRAFLVLGSEGSGTRYLTQLLIDAGCAGSAEHRQPWDACEADYDALAIPVPPADVPAELVLRRSVPHGTRGQWCDLPRIITTLQEHEYEIRALVTVRDWEITGRSLARAGHTLTPEEGIARVAHAYPWIQDGLAAAGVPGMLVTYHSLGRQQYRRWLELFLGLPDTFQTPFEDGDRRYATEVLH